MARKQSKTIGTQCVQVLIKGVQNWKKCSQEMS